MVFQWCSKDLPMISIDLWWTTTKFAMIFQQIHRIFPSSTWSTCWIHDRPSGTVAGSEASPVMAKKMPTPPPKAPSGSFRTMGKSFLFMCVNQRFLWILWILWTLYDSMDSRDSMDSMDSMWNIANCECTATEMFDGLFRTSAHYKGGINGDVISNIYGWKWCEYTPTWDIYQVRLDVFERFWCCGAYPDVFFLLGESGKSWMICASLKMTSLQPRWKFEQIDVIKESSSAVRWWSIRIVGTTRAPLSLKVVVDLEDDQCCPEERFAKRCNDSQN